MVIVLEAGAILGLPFLTGFLAADAKPLGGFGLVYQSLPGCRSGSNPATGDLYQLLPPPDRRLTTDSHIHDTVAGWVWWTTVITVDNVENRENTQGESERWWSASKRFF